METLAQVFTNIISQPSQLTIPSNPTPFETHLFETQTNHPLTPSTLETWQIFPV
ncbi:MAG: hypothetical protein R6U67_09640 [Sodalinema sp.]|uniref:hypothetical protein n=1 Tax=Sodalinema sp. TaxID=3080550 RepID=UPI00396F70C1